jgi:hypothetical protein
LRGQLAHERCVARDPRRLSGTELDSSSARTISAGALLRTLLADTKSGAQALDERFTLSYATFPRRAIAR